MYTYLLAHDKVKGYFHTQGFSWGQMDLTAYIKLLNHMDTVKQSF